MKEFFQVALTILIVIGACVGIYYIIDDIFVPDKDLKAQREEAIKRSEEEQKNLVMKPTYVAGVAISVYNYNGHEYIIADGGYGCCIIHSESCQCKYQ